MGKLAKLLFRDINGENNTPVTDKKEKKQQSTTSISEVNSSQTPSGSHVQAKPTNYSAPVYNPGRSYQSPEQKHWEDEFVDLLQDLIEKNNQEGFDFLEFTESLLETSERPGPMEYKMVFKIAQKMDASISVQSLIESARKYKELVDSAATSAVGDGERKKSTLQTQMSTTKSNLEQDINANTNQIRELEDKIEKLKLDSDAKSKQLSDIENEYQPQFAEIDAKINAMNTAKSTVISTIESVEQGIQNNIGN